MLQLRHVQRALGWCLVGLLLTYVLINAIGFVSPFWGLWRHPGDPGASSSLLHAWQSITPWFSICFAVAAWHLARTAQAMAARIGIVVMGALVPVAHVGASFARRTIDQAGSPVSPELSAPMDVLADAYLGLAALVFVALIWRAVRQSNRSLESNAMRGSA